MYEHKKRKMNKRYYILSVCISLLGCMFFYKKTYAQETLPVVIINQLRGSESCCDSGDPDMFTKLNSHAQIKDLPLAWAIRFDVLNDKTQVEKIKTSGEQTLGILLEITPKLALASGVKYKGKINGEDWYAARNAFLIGYTQAERKHLLDTVFEIFKKRFNRYPEFTVAWMIDSWSLDYIHKNFGVNIHEITKEQYETDDYTLYGGIFNIPYYASILHPLIPSTDTSQVMIFRQTISDIEESYGSYQSFYTSQPNDYLSRKLGNFNYFTKLIDQARSQADGNKFALLGLENSKEWVSNKDEFIKQLDYVYEQKHQGNLKTYSPLEYYNTVSRQARATGQYHYLKSPEFPKQGVFWFFGERYRILLERRGDKIILSDLRIFTNQSDRYTNVSVSTNRAYWVIPYLLDSSQQYTVVKESRDIYRGNPVRRDNSVDRFGIELSPNSITGLDIQEGKIILKNETAEIILDPEKITVKSQTSPRLSQPISLSFSDILTANTEQYYLFKRHPRFFIRPEKDKHQLFLGWENIKLQQVVMASVINRENEWLIVPNIDLKQEEIDSLAVIFQPDFSTYGFDKQISTFYWHNTEAIAGRSSARLYIDPRNIFERPVPIKNLKITSTDPEILINPSQDPEVSMEEFFIDFSASNSAQSTLTVSTSGNPVLSQSINFYIDCRREFWICITNWKQFQGYLRIIIRDKTQIVLSLVYLWKDKFVDLINNLFNQVFQLRI